MRDFRYLLSIILLSGCTFYAQEKIEQSGSSTRAKLFSAVDVLSDQLIAGDAYLGRARLMLLSDRVLRYDFSPDHASSISPHDVAVRSLDALIRVKVLRRDFPKVFPLETFWVQPLNNIYSAIRVLDAKSDEAVNQSSYDASVASIERQFQALEVQTMSAAGAGRIDAGESARDRPSGFKVSVHIKPPKARVRCMPLLTYLRCTRISGLSLDTQWIELPDGSTEALVGKYWYRAEWRELGQTLEGTFEIADDKTLTFSPQAGK